MIRSSFLSIEEEGKYSIDEMMVPYKGTKLKVGGSTLKINHVNGDLKLLLELGFQE